MVEFYNHLLNGKSYTTALRLAKLKLLEEEATALPLYWSAFQLIGQ